MDFFHSKKCKDTSDPCTRKTVDTYCTFVYLASDVTPATHLKKQFIITCNCFLNFCDLKQLISGVLENSF